MLSVPETRDLEVVDVHDLHIMEPSTERRVSLNRVREEMDGQDD